MHGSTVHDMHGSTVHTCHHALLRGSHVASPEIRSTSNHLPCTKRRRLNASQNASTTFSCPHHRSATMMQNGREGGNRKGKRGADSMRQGDMRGSGKTGGTAAEAARCVAAGETTVTRDSSARNGSCSMCNCGTSGTFVSPQHFRRCLRVLERAGAGPTVSEGTKYYEIAADGKPQMELLLLLRMARMQREHIDEVESATVAEMEEEKSVQSGSESDSGGEGGMEHSLVKIAEIVCRVGELQSTFLDVKSNEGHANSDCVMSRLITYPVASSLARVISFRNGMYSFKLPKDLRLIDGIGSCWKALNAARLRVAERCVLLRCLISYAR